MFSLWWLCHWRLSLKSLLLHHPARPWWPGCCPGSRHWSTFSPLWDWEAAWPSLHAAHSTVCSSSLCTILHRVCCLTGHGELSYKEVRAAHMWSCAMGWIFQLTAVCYPLRWSGWPLKWKWITEDFSVSLKYCQEHTGWGQSALPRPKTWTWTYCNCSAS